jgi:uncharacterized membrane protein YgcG
VAIRSPRSSVDAVLVAFAVVLVGDHVHEGRRRRVFDDEDGVPPGLALTDDLRRRRTDVSDARVADGLQMRTRLRDVAQVALLTAVRNFNRSTITRGWSAGLAARALYCSGVGSSAALMRQMHPLTLMRLPTLAHTSTFGAGGGRYTGGGGGGGAPGGGGGGAPGGGGGGSASLR